MCYVSSKLDDNHRVDYNAGAGLAQVRLKYDKVLLGFVGTESYGRNRVSKGYDHLKYIAGVIIKW
jgi:hypothetical protein